MHIPVHRAALSVVALEDQHRQQRVQHPAPVVGVRGAQGRAHPGFVAHLVRGSLNRERAQGRLTAGHREDHLAHDVARVGHRRGRDPEHRHEPFRDVREQIRRQLQAAHPLQLGHLRQQALQPRRPRVLLELVEKRPAAARCAFALRARLGDQFLQQPDRCRREASDSGGAEPLVERAHGRTDQAIDLAGGRRFHPLRPAPGHHCADQALTRKLDSAQLRRQPHGELLLVRLRALAEAEERAYLHAGAPDRPARPVIGSEPLGGDADLLGDIGHRRGRDLPGRIWKPRLRLEELQ